MKTLATEIDKGFPNVRGAHVQASLPLRQNVLDDLLRSDMPDVTLKLMDDNAATVMHRGFGFLKIHFKLTNLRARPPHTVSFDVSGPAIAALKTARWLGKIPPFIDIDGHSVSVNLARMPVMARYPQLLSRISLRHLAIHLHCVTLGLEFKAT